MIPSSTRLIARGIIQIGSASALAMLPVALLLQIVLRALEVESDFPRVLVAFGILLGLVFLLGALILPLVPQGTEVPTTQSWDL
jgi:predicted transporter